MFWSDVPGWVRGDKGPHTDVGLALNWSKAVRSWRRREPRGYRVSCDSGSGSSTVLPEAGRKVSVEIEEQVGRGV